MPVDEVVQEALDADLGPFADPGWRSDLAALRWTAEVAAQAWAMDARTLVSLAPASRGRPATSAAAHRGRPSCARWPSPSA